MTAVPSTTPPSAVAPTRPTGPSTAATLRILTGTETKLFGREWAAMLFAFVFPPLMMLVLAGVFAGDDDVFGGANGADYYVAAYIGIPMGALAMIGLPVMLASYRERGVLRRFEAFGISTAKVAGAQVIVTAGLVVIGAALVLVVAAPMYGVPAIDDPVQVILGFLFGLVTMLSLGVAIGLAAPNARAAQALGLLAFLPMWLLGGGGPPPEVMTDGMRSVSDLLPLWHATAAIREPWLGTGELADHTLGLGVWLVIGLAACTALLRRRSG